VGLKLIFLTVSGAMSLLRLSRREDWWKDQSWVVQQARNLLMDLDDAGMSVKFVLHDRDASFTAAFDTVFQSAGARVVRCAVQAPRMNSIMERWIGSCRRELLDRTLIWNQRHLMTVLREYEDFCNTHRPHQRWHCSLRAGEMTQAREGQFRNIRTSFTCPGILNHPSKRLRPDIINHLRALTLSSFSRLPVLDKGLRRAHTGRGEYLGNVYIEMEVHSLGVLFIAAAKESPRRGKVNREVSAR
jgi:hypothetical protein